MTTCRTCGRPITWETRTSPNWANPRTGWYDDMRVDPFICFSAIDYRHTPREEDEVVDKAGFREYDEAKAQMLRVSDIVLREEQS